MVLTDQPLDSCTTFPKNLRKACRNLIPSVKKEFLQGSETQYTGKVFHVKHKQGILAILLLKGGPLWDCSIV